MASAQINSAERQPGSIEHQNHIEQAGRLYSAAIDRDDKDLLEKALTAANKAYQEDPDYLPGINLLARIELQRQHLAHADYWATLGLRKKPDSASLLYSAGHIALARSDLKQAESLFNKACKISRVATKAALYLAHVKFLQGDYPAAFGRYRELIKTHADDVQIKHKLIDAASYVHADQYTLELEQDVSRYLNFTDVDHNGLRNLATSLLKEKLQLSKAGCPLELQQLISDPLLIQCLSRFYFTDPIIEQLLLTIRRSLLVSCSQELAIDEALLPFIVALGYQCALNEYVWYEDHVETELVQKLIQLANDICKVDDITTIDIYPLILLIAMYRPISTMTSFNIISELQSKTPWPTVMKELMALIIDQPEQLTRIRKNIKTIEGKDETTKISNCVKQQYEEFPYPRWNTLPYQQRGHYFESLLSIFPNLNGKLPTFSNRRPIKVMVAGCGTGRHAITLAQYFKQLDITAIDLSYSSLSYAKLQAKHFEIPDSNSLNNNEENKVSCLNFMQEDILNLPAQPTYDIIEVSGVLHHMENPMAGLEVLVNQLKPGGLIKIGLYSESARQSITHLRQQISLESVTTIDDIRTLRQAIISATDNQHWQDILQSPDFYSASGCRDLLCHQQEHVFNQTTLESLIESTRCQWVGMIPPPGYQTITKASDDIPKTLEEWCLLEQANPSLFAGMYQFYLRKPIQQQWH